MSWLHTAGTGLRAIATHRLRSILTALGILIGVAAVIATVGVGTASAQSVTARINSLGTNLLTVSGGSVATGGVQGGAGSATSLTMIDAAALKSHANAPDISAVAPVVQRSRTLQAGSATWTTTVAGSTQDWLVANSRSMGSGAFFTSADVSGHSHVAVLGTTTAQNLGVQVGDVINIGQVPYSVVGILASSGSQGFANQDDTAVVPITTYQDDFGGGDLSVQRILLSAASSDVVGSAYTEANDLLLQTHHATGSSPDFTITSQSSILSTVQSVTQTLTLLLASVAAISLLVGGIGVMNIMLVSVTERITEIGLRKALGATSRDIRRQFLIEAAALSAIGGILGVAVGVLTIVLLPKFTSIGMALSAPSIVVSVVVATAIGLIFGVYPAVRAARLAPIEALRAQ